MTDSISVETIAVALDSLRADIVADHKAGYAVAHALIYGCRMNMLGRVRAVLIPQVEVGKPSRPILPEDITSATRGLGLRDKTVSGLVALQTAHGQNLAFTSQVIVAAAKAEQDRRFGR